MTYKTNDYYMDSVANRKPIAPSTAAEKEDRQRRQEAAAIEHAKALADAEARWQALWNSCIL
jgi:hypothetical protein